MKLKCFDIDLATEENNQLKKLLKTDDESETVNYDDYSVQSMIFAMVKDLEIQVRKFWKLNDN